MLCIQNKNDSCLSIHTEKIFFLFFEAFAYNNVSFLYLRWLCVRLLHSVCTICTCLVMEESTDPIMPPIASSNLLQKFFFFFFLDIGREMSYNLFVYLL
jgi:hypothetical protein